jgi:hypothetical protein
MPRNAVASQVTDRDDPLEHALERDRRALDPRRRYDLARLLREADLGELVGVRVELERRAVHLIRLRERDKVGHELTGVADVDKRVLQRDAVGPRLQAQRHDRRFAAHAREERDRRQVGDAISGQCADPADRSWNDAADQQLVRGRCIQVRCVDDHDALLSIDRVASDRRSSAGFLACARTHFK